MAQFWSPLDCLLLPSVVVGNTITYSWIDNNNNPLVIDRGNYF